MLDLSLIQSQNTRGTTANGAKGAENNSEETDTTDFAAEYDDVDDATAMPHAASGDTEIDPQKMEEDAAKPNVAAEEPTVHDTTDRDRAEATDEFTDNDQVSGDMPLFAAAETTGSGKLPPSENARSKDDQQRMFSEKSKRPDQPLAGPSSEVKEGGQSTRPANDADETIAAQSEVAKRSTAETVVLTRALQATDRQVEAVPQSAKRVETNVAPAGPASQTPARGLTAQNIPDAAQNSADLRFAPQLPSDTKEPRNSRDAEKRLDVIDLPQPRKPATLVPPPPLVGATHFVQSKIATHTGLQDGIETVVDDLDILQSFDQRTAQQTSSTQLQHVLQRAETPAMIARQMAEALQKLPDRPVEISLNPKELGRVRMNISAAEAGITVNVMAERPETLDLMRRHIDQLTREFEVIGYSDINFAFSQDQTQQDFSDNGDEANHATVSHFEIERMEDTTSTPLSAMPTSGVDIRV